MKLQYISEAFKGKDVEVDSSQSSRRPHARELLKRAFCHYTIGAKVRLPCSRDDNFIASVLLTFQLSNGTIFEIPHSVFIVFSHHN